MKELLGFVGAVGFLWFLWWLTGGDISFVMLIPGFFYILWLSIPSYDYVPSRAFAVVPSLIGLVFLGIGASYGKGPEVVIGIVLFGLSLLKAYSIYDTAVRREKLNEARDGSKEPVTQRGAARTQNRGPKAARINKRGFP